MGYNHYYKSKVVMFVNAHVYPVAMMIIMLVAAITNAAVLRSGGF